MLYHTTIVRSLLDETLVMRMQCVTSIMKLACVVLSTHKASSDATVTRNLLDGTVAHLHYYVFMFIVQGLNDGFFI